MDVMHEAEKVTSPLVVAVCPDARASQTLEFVFNKLTKLGDRIVVLHVLDNIPVLPPLPAQRRNQTEAVESAWIDAHKQQAELQIMNMVEQSRKVWEKKKASVEIHIIPGRDAGKSLITEARRLGACMLVVGSHGKSSLTGRLTGISRSVFKHPPLGSAVCVVSNGAVIASKAAFASLEPTSSSSSKAPTISPGSASPAHSLQSPHSEDGRGADSDRWKIWNSLISPTQSEGGPGGGKGGGSFLWSPARHNNDGSQSPSTSSSPVHLQLPPKPQDQKKQGLKRPDDGNGSGLQRGLSFAWDDSVVGVKSSGRQGSGGSINGLNKPPRSSSGDMLSHLPAASLAAASGLARQGSGVPTARLMAMEAIDSRDLGMKPLVRMGSGMNPLARAASGLPGLGRLSSGIPSLSRKSSGVPNGGLEGSPVSPFLSGSSDRSNCSGVIDPGLLSRPSDGSPILLSDLFNACRPSRRESGGGATENSKSRSMPFGSQEFLPPPSPTSSGAKFFGYKEISAATNGFRETSRVGKGGFAEVFSGVLPNGKRIAVKRLFQKTKSEIEFLTEVGIVSHVKHAHVTGLLGYSLDQKNRLLIYELLENGSLEGKLHIRANAKVELNWDRRLNIAIGAAKGLEYLHHECPRRIIHRDVKSANILLDKDYNAQICDFGLAKWVPDSHNVSSLAPVEGTFGYMAPEYFMHGEMNEKMDVYAFGMVLLELITGRRPIDVKRMPDERNLLAWAQPVLESGKVQKILDPKLGGRVDHLSLRRIAAAALCCVRYNPELRPTMGEVAKMLEDNYLDDEKLQKHWSMLAEKSQMFGSDLQRFDSVGKDYTDTMYHRDMQQHMALALASPEGLVRST